jgi:hypothetical protein
VRFTVTSPVAPLVPVAPRPASPLASLGRFWRGETSPGVYEVTKAVTADGEWIFERQPDGTWSTGHLPTKTVVKPGLRSLPACRRYAGTGKAQADLEQMKQGVTKGLTN